MGLPPSGVNCLEGSAPKMRVVVFVVIVGDSVVERARARSRMPHGRNGPTVPARARDCRAAVSYVPGALSP